jgi:hypothetical protein
LSSSSSVFRRRKKLLKDIQRLGFASAARLLLSECKMDSASVDLVGLEGLVQLVKCLCKRLLAWYGEEVERGGGKGGGGSLWGLLINLEGGVVTGLVSESF